MKKRRGMDLFYELLLVRVCELGYVCPPVSDPVVQMLCNDQTLSRGINPAQAIKFMECLRNKRKTVPRPAWKGWPSRAATGQGGATSCQTPQMSPPGNTAPQPPQSSARSLMNLFRSGTAGRSAAQWAAYIECEQVLGCCHRNGAVSRCGAGISRRRRGWRCQRCAACCAAAEDTRARLASQL